MIDLIVYAIPAFVLLLAVEAISFRVAAPEDLKGYELRDTHTSISMDDRLGYMFGGPGWKPENVPGLRSGPEVLPARGGGAPPPTGPG